MSFTPAQKKKLSALTPFERAALLECAKIPEGKTRSYSHIARAVGKPQAARAVGNALAKNPLAPLIPCHRVVKKDGKIGGYSARGGARKKRSLLIQERYKHLNTLIYTFHPAVGMNGTGRVQHY